MTRHSLPPSLNLYLSMFPFFKNLSHVYHEGGRGGRGEGREGREEEGEGGRGGRGEGREGGGEGGRGKTSKTNTHIMRLLPGHQSRAEGVIKIGLGETTRLCLTVQTSMRC